MKKMHGRLCIMIGAALLLAALSLVLYNLNKDSQGGKASQELLAELKLEMPQISSDDGNLSNNDLFKEYEDDEPDQDNFIEVNGRIYAGVIYIPSLQLELPVLSEWSYDNLDISPCRYSGSAFKGNLIMQRTIIVPILADYKSLEVEILLFLQMVKELYMSMKLFRLKLSMAETLKQWSLVQRIIGT